MPGGRKYSAKWKARRDRAQARYIKRAFLMRFTSFFRLEPAALKGLSRGPEEVCCKPVVAAPSCEIATGDPRGGAMPGRTELVEARLGSVERFLGLIGLVLLEQRATKYELRASDLVDVVLVAGRLEEPKRMARLLLGLVAVAHAAMNLR